MIKIRLTCPRCGDNHIVDVEEVINYTGQECSIARDLTCPNTNESCQIMDNELDLIWSVLLELASDTEITISARTM